MNILPLVIVFISVFLLLSSLLFERPIALAKMKAVHCAYWKGERSWRNLYAQKTFNKAHLATKKETTDPKPQIEHKSSGYARDGAKENGKLCLARLFDPACTAKEQKILRKITSSFFQETYGRAPFYQEAKKKWEDFEERLLSFFEERAKKHPEATTLLELAQEDHPLASVLFHMFQGTNGYDSIQGYPPLDHIIVMRRISEKKAVAFPFASNQLLQAIVGEELAKTIIALEKEKSTKAGKPKCLLKKELKELIMESDSLLSWDEIELICSFTRKSGLNEYLTTKAKTGELAIRRNHSTFGIHSAPMNGQQKSKDRPLPNL